MCISLFTIRSARPRCRIDGRRVIVEVLPTAMRSHAFAFCRIVSSRGGSAAFGAAHGSIDSSEETEKVFATGVIAIPLALAYAATGSIVVPMILHGLNN